MASFALPLNPLPLTVSSKTPSIDAFCHRATLSINCFVQASCLLAVAMSHVHRLLPTGGWSPQSWKTDQGRGSVIFLRHEREWLSCSLPGTAGDTFALTDSELCNRIGLFFYFYFFLKRQVHAQVCRKMHQRHYKEGLWV
ncbi:hypothetical protein BDW66DRAFT_49491 [Aspergillus desertorum]